MAYPAGHRALALSACLLHAGDALLVLAAQALQPLQLRLECLALLERSLRACSSRGLSRETWRRGCVQCIRLWTSDARLWRMALPRPSCTPGGTTKPAPVHLNITSVSGIYLPHL